MAPAVDNISLLKTAFLSSECTLSLSSSQHDQPSMSTTVITEQDHQSKESSGESISSTPCKDQYSLFSSHIGETKRIGGVDLSVTLYFNGHLGHEFKRQNHCFKRVFRKQTAEGIEEWQYDPEKCLYQVSGCGFTTYQHIMDMLCKTSKCTTCQYELIESSNSLPNHHQLVEQIYVTRQHFLSLKQCDFKRGISLKQDVDDALSDVFDKSTPSQLLYNPLQTGNKSELSNVSESPLCCDLESDSHLKQDNDAEISQSHSVCENLSKSDCQNVPGKQVQCSKTEEVHNAKSLSDQDVAECLVASALHPSVVSMIVNIFKEQCKQKHHKNSGNVDH